MTHPDLMTALARGRMDVLRRSAGPRLPEHHVPPSRRIDVVENAVTLRLAVAIQEDEVIGRLAALDDSGIPAAPVLLAVVDGEPLAALSLTDGKAIADRFHRTAHLVDLLRSRARQFKRTKPDEPTAAIAAAIRARNPSQVKAMAIDHADTAAPAVETVGLSKSFGDRLAVDAVNLAVPRGVVYGLLGHNGAGKTTLIRMLLGLTNRSAGDVRLLGLPIPERHADALARVGALVEEPPSRAVSAPFSQRETSALGHRQP